MDNIDGALELVGLAAVLDPANVAVQQRLTEITHLQQQQNLPPPAPAPINAEQVPLIT